MGGRQIKRKNAMNKIKNFRKWMVRYRHLKIVIGFVRPDYFNLQLSGFKLGDWKCGNKAFDYAVSLQNKSGGWFWRIQCIYSYAKWQKIKYAGNEGCFIFSRPGNQLGSEIFFDALYYRELVEFEHKAHTFMDYIDSSDSKYKIVFEEMLKQQENGKN